MVEPEQTVDNTPEVEDNAVEEAKPVYRRKKGILRKKEVMALAAKNMKMSSWLRNETRINNEEREDLQSRRPEYERVMDMDWTDETQQ